MRRIFYIGLMVSLYSCGPLMYNYKFSMKESQKPKKLYYKDDSFSISFDFYLEGLMIDFTNQSDEPIKINWDELRMTENETSKKIEHIVINDGGIIVYQPPSIISPESGYSDLVVYADNIYYLKEDGKEKMKIKDMYPKEGNKNTRDSIQKLKGQRITLLLPIEIKNVSHSWVFNFLLEDIKSTRETILGYLPPTLGK
jgi:hypothetical protein